MGLVGGGVRCVDLIYARGDEGVLMIAQRKEKIMGLVYYTSLASAMTSNLAALIYASLETQRSDTWRYSDAYSSAIQFSTEAWLCQLRGIAQYPKEFENDCRIAVSLGQG